MRPRDGKPTGKEDWYTPQPILILARAVLGRIDLDPASCAEANERVGAAQFYDEATDGLSKEWHGNVWLNPPYSKGKCARFVERMVTHRQGLLLTNAATDAKWWQSAAENADAVCLLKARISFIDGATGKLKRGNGMGQSVFCFGEQLLPRFVEYFRPMGVVTVAVGTQL